MANSLVVAFERGFSGSGVLVGIGLSPGRGDFPLLGISNAWVFAR